MHSGDPSIYGAIAEQMRRLDGLGIPYDVMPGVPAFAAAAAELKREFTLPEIAQTIILTRTSMQASPMPEGERLEELGRTARDARHPSVDPQPRLRRAGADAALRRRLPGRRRLPRHLARPEDHPRHARDHRQARCAPPGSPAPRSSSSAACWARRVSATRHCTIPPTSSPAQPQDRGEHRMTKLMGLSGSLRAGSYNTAPCCALPQLMPERCRTRDRHDPRHPAL